jgi:hypothetical protein
VKYVRCIGMPEVSRDHVRSVFNRTEGKIEVVVLKESGSIRMFPKTLCSKLLDRNWTIGVDIETTSSSPLLSAYSTI